MNNAIKRVKASASSFNQVKEPLPKDRWIPSRDISKNPTNSLRRLIKSIWPCVLSLFTPVHGLYVGICVIGALPMFFSKGWQIVCRVCGSFTFPINIFLSFISLCWWWCREQGSFVWCSLSWFYGPHKLLSSPDRKRQRWNAAIKG